ncbi:hypothetical protein LCGC14_2563880, partial [marine sediment metagenome]
MSGDITMGGKEITGLGSAITGTKNTALTISIPTQGADDAVGVGISITADTGGSGGTGNVGGAININAGDAAGAGDNNGGSIILSPGDKVNSGTDGHVLIPDAHKLYFNDVGGEFIEGTGSALNFYGGGNQHFSLTGVTQFVRPTLHTLTTAVRFRDSAINISSSVDGQMDINADVELEIIAPLVDVAGSMLITSARTTTDAFTIQADALTSGSIARFATDSAETDVGNLVEIVNDNTAAVGNTPLMIQQDAVTSTNFKKIATLAGFTIWISDGTTAEAALTGVEGDICLNGGTGNGQTAYCNAAGTNWTDM